ncbi:MAG TPA: DUF4255 domain-containing protein [Candidatus Nanoarchaeia archaeon]|nr:DUF4255 domain-containing protein [Candidatus Nanoarchaeia archaeon]
MIIADFAVIADVGETLIELLRENMKDLINPDSIMLISPGDIEGSDTVRLSLFLYQITENAHMKNQEMMNIGSTGLKNPPLTFDLYYMLTSHPSTGIQDKTERTKEEHSVLGKAMQVLNDNSLLKGSVLRGSLAENNEELRMTLTTLNLDDMTKIWTTFQDKLFRPSLCYLVTPVKIDSSREKQVKRVVERKLNNYLKA